MVWGAPYLLWVELYPPKRWDMIVAVSGKLPALSLPMERRKCPPSGPAEKSNDLMYIQMFLMDLKMLYNFFFFFSFQKGYIWKLPQGVPLEILLDLDLANNGAFMWEEISRRVGYRTTGVLWVMEGGKRGDFWWRDLCALEARVFGNSIMSVSRVCEREHR